MSAETDRTAQALALRLFSAGLGAAELMTAYLGLRLGLYEALAERPATPGELARRCAVDERYVQEWLEQQAAAGMLTVDDARRPAAARAYGLPAGHAEVLLDPDSPYATAPMVMMPVGGMSAVLPLLVERFRTGEGVPYEAYGEDLRGGQAGLNKRVFDELLPGWISRHAPDVRDRLTAGARVLDIACGNGRSTLALAHHYPATTVHGVDLDPASVAEAERHAESAPGAGNVRFTTADAADLDPAESYDVICLFDALHDMSRPVDVLSAARRLLRPGGAMLLLEPNAGERFTAPASDTERYQYAISVLHCLPVGRASAPSAATGTVMRPGTVRRYAREAGFGRVSVIDLGHTFHRMYRLY